MKPYIYLLPLTFTACASPVITSNTLEENVDSKDTPSSEDVEDTELADSDDTMDQTEQGSETDDNNSDDYPTGDSSTYVLESTTWFVAEATMIEDSCELDTPLRQFFGIGSDALLPSDFTVEGFDGFFKIEANSYGASGPITCGFDETEFDCQTQTVTPLDFDLGTYGWTYAIEFSGIAESERVLTGIAEVRFPTVSDWLIPLFQSTGIDYSQCVQSFELKLSID